MIGKIIYVFLFQAVFLTLYKVTIYRVPRNSTIQKSTNFYNMWYESCSFIRLIDCYLISLITLAIMRIVFQEMSVISYILLKVWLTALKIFEVLI